MRPIFLLVLAPLAVHAPPPAAAEVSGTAGEGIARLVRAYPDHLDRIEGNTLVWRDGTRMALDDAKGVKPFEAWLDDPDIEDMLRLAYPAGAPAAPPERNADPGRARNAAFFEKMYGDCRKGEVARHLADVAWLPGRTRQVLKVTTVNRVNERLAAVSTELARLPERFDVYLVPASGTYNCRPIAGTSRTSAHGYGIAIDIAVAHAHYWWWSRMGAGGTITYANEIPLEIVRIFEAHGFIWGGRWYHHDTMHFEYRPELLPEAR
jgi:hypothetical protein